MQQSVPGQALLPRRPAADVAGGAAELRVLAAGRRRAVCRGPHRLLDVAAAVRFAATNGACCSSMFTNRSLHLRILLNDCGRLWL